MSQPYYRMGLDVGSTTAKITVFNATNQLIYSRYERHNAKVGQLVSLYLEELSNIIGNAQVSLYVTGSVGMATAEQLGVPFAQEVVAATVLARHRYPQAKALIDIGGEDAKVVFFNGKNMELRMNGNCAGGTGAFLDQMAVLMGKDNQQLSDLALKSNHIYPMAARCGVFAKTDIQNLMSRNLPAEDIAASIFHSIAVQTVVTLSHGCDFKPPILLCGGPLTFLPALRQAFANYLKLQENDFIVSSDSNLIPAMGCAIMAGERRRDNNTPQQVTDLHTLKQRLDRKTELHWHSNLQPLFTNEAEHQAWLASKAPYATNIQAMRPGRQRVVIGIDSGSTTTKLVAIRLDDQPSKPLENKTNTPDIIFTNYRMNLGNPIKAVADALQALREEAEHAGAQLDIVGSCSTGYGEELIKAAFKLDTSIIETIAHYRAAASLMPDVSFILDIGGQDMKAIFVENGAVVRMELNEACSSGCGTFIQTFANSLNYPINEFASMACTAKAPCDLGTRCTVFMNSKVKQVLREGATVADISAGIAYSVIKNCLYKVLKLRGNDSLGGHIVVQGGTMRNDAVVRAFELLTGQQVARSNMPELMGAIGCALQAAHLATNEPKLRDSARNVADLIEQSHYNIRQLQCKGCENHCLVSRYDFTDKSHFFSGNKCERIFNNNGGSKIHGNNIYIYKYQLLFDRPLLPNNTKKTPHAVIGLPRVLNMYEDYPFWNTLLREAGFEVVLSSESTFYRYEGALHSVMADNICFPAKLVHSHISELNANQKVERILMPYVVYECNDDKRNLNSFNCPIVSGYSDVIKSAMPLDKPIDAPIINFSDERLLAHQIIDYLHTLGVGTTKARHALQVALKEQKHFVTLLQQKARQIWDESRKNKRLTMLLAGRPYHTDPLIQHKLAEMTATLGVDVISDDIVRGDLHTQVSDTYLVQQWAYMNRIVKSAQWAAEQDGQVHFVQMTSFGCGPDSFIQDEIRDLLRRHGKPYTLLKIDDVSNTGSLKLRIRSLVESLRNKNSAETIVPTPLTLTRVFKKADTHRKILAPYLTEYLTPVIAPILRLIGYDVEVLPMADSESAEIGLRFANNEVCYPATLIVGDIIKALKSGKYDLNNTAIVMSQTGGQCRATNYAGLIKRAMVANGLQDVPFITLGVTATADSQANEQEGFHIPWFKYSAIIVTSILFGDAISEMYYACAVREDKPGIARRLRDKYMQATEPLILKNDSNGLIALLEEAAKDFNSHTVNKKVPQVGIVGEIFLKFNPFSHEFIERHIMARGIEIVPPLLAPFFLQEFVNIEAQKYLRLSTSHIPNFVIRGIYQTVIGRKLRKVNKAASKFRYFRPFTNIYDDAKEVDGVVSLAAQFGEGWLLPSDIIAYLRDGINNIISLQPFGCIANHVVSKGIEKKLHRLYPQLNMVSLDFDSGVSSVNVINRLLLFLDNVAV